jgi:hypothetical protein
MRTVAALVLALLAASLPLAAPTLARDDGTEAPPPATEAPPAGEGDAGKDDDDAGEEDGGPLAPRAKRKLDRTSPVAQALDDLLVVDPRYTSDGTVELVYEFRQPNELQDWTQEGLDRAEETGPRGNDVRRRRNPNAKLDHLALGANASPGRFLHRLAFKGDHEAVFRCSVLRSTTDADLVFLTGKGGAPWGTCLAKASGSRWSGLDGAVDRAPWNGGQVVTVRLAVTGDEVEVEVDGVRRAATRKLGVDSDGKVGLLLRNLHLVVHRATLRGKVDPAKL